MTPGERAALLHGASRTRLSGADAVDGKVGVHLSASASKAWQDGSHSQARYVHTSAQLHTYIAGGSMTSNAWYPCMAVRPIIMTVHVTGVGQNMAGHLGAWITFL